MLRAIGRRRSSLIIRVGWRGVTFEVFEHGFIECRFADDVLLARPVPEIEQAATLAAKRKLSVGFRIRRLLANRAARRHAKSIPQRHRARSPVRYDDRQPRARTRDGHRSCGVRRLAAAVCRTGLPVRAARLSAVAGGWSWRIARASDWSGSASYIFGSPPGGTAPRSCVEIP